MRKDGEVCVGLNPEARRENDKGEKMLYKGSAQSNYKNQISSLTSLVVP